MKCLFVSAGMLFGGAERVTSILTNEWGKKDCEIKILVTSTEAISKYPLSKNVQVISYSEEIKNNKFGQIAIIKKIREICIEWEPNVVISFFNDLCALSAVAIIGLHIPLVYSERNDPNKTNQRFIDRIYRRIVEKRTDKIVFQTKGAQKLYSLKVQEKSTVIINPLNTEQFPIHDFMNERKEIVSVGRLESQKNQKLLITAFSLISKKFPEYRLVIYGEGNLRKELESYIKEKGLMNRVTLPGTKNNILEYIKDSSLFVLSSDYEGLPNALIEAMAIGLPCISTDCSPGGARELITNEENGLITECGNAVELSNAMSRMLIDRDCAKRYAKKALEVRERTNVEKISSDWLRCINEN